MKIFREFTVSTRPFDADILSGLLWNFDIAGITENDQSLTVYTKEDSELTISVLKSFLKGIKKQGLIKNFDISTQEFEDKNWNEEWEKKTDIIEISDKIVIKPTFRKYNNIENKVIIQIDPKMSFGTGEHETTRMMLILLEKYIKPNLDILDVGTGTGILAIASALLTNSKSILAIDNDEWCILNSKENILINDLTGVIKIKLAEISNIQKCNFDLITANINKSVLYQIADSLFEKLKSFGILILSGIYKKELDEVISYFEKFGFQKLEKFSMNEWAAIVFKKN